MAKKSPSKSVATTEVTTSLITTDGSMDYNKLAELREQMLGWLETLEASKKKASPKDLVLLDWEGMDTNVSECTDSKKIGELAAFVAIKKMAAEHAASLGFEAPTTVSGKTFDEIFEILKERKNVAEADEKIAVLKEAIKEIEGNSFFKKTFDFFKIC